MKSKGKNYIVILSSFLVVLIFLILFILVVTLKSSKKSELYKTEYYKYLYYDPLENASRVGRIKKLKENKFLENRGYLTFVNSKGRYMLISKFGLKHYRCYGNCACNKNRIRKNKQELFHLVASRSQRGAEHVVSHSFRKGCKKQKPCLNRDYDSNPEISCYGVLDNPSYDDSEEVYDEELKKRAIEDRIEYGNYVFNCKGTCIKETHYTEVLIKAAEEFDCSELSKVEEIELPNESTEKDAVRVFSSLHLESHCNIYSPMWDPEDKKKIVHLCQGGTPRTNPSVECKRYYISMEDVLGEEAEEYQYPWDRDDYEEEDFDLNDKLLGIKRDSDSDSDNDTKEKEKKMEKDDDEYIESEEDLERILKELLDSHSEGDQEDEEFDVNDWNWEDESVED